MFFLSRALPVTVRGSFLDRAEALRCDAHCHELHDAARVVLSAPLNC
jgi:hypothetical protein